MPLPLPDLDDRRWSDLVDEARSLIHRNAPAWTDYNLSDPGITVLDLLAWIAEADIFAIDRIPHAHRAQFLALADIVLRRAVPARTPLQFGTSLGRIHLAAGLVFAAATDGGDDVVHTLSHPVDVLGCALTAVQAWTGTDYIDRTQDWRHGSAFDALGPDPSVGAALLLGLDPDPALDPAAQLSVWIGIDGTPISPPDHSAPPMHHSARVAWEYHDGTDWTPFIEDVFDDTRSLTRTGRVGLPFGEVGAALVSIGAVTQPRRWVRARLAAGRHDIAPAVTALLVDAAPVVQSGAAFATWIYAVDGYAPPAEFVRGAEISFDVRTDASGRVLAFDTTTPKPHLPYARVLDASADGVALTLLCGGVADGAPSFVASLPDGPFSAEHAAVWISDENGATAWKIVDTLRHSGPNERHVVFDPAAGTLTFGDGWNGRIPAASSTVLVRANTTAGAAGTPTRRSRWRLDVRHPVTAAITSSAAIDVTKLRVSAADGFSGRPADDLDAGAGRAADRVWAHERLVELGPDTSDPTLDQVGRTAALKRRRPERAATTLDFERIALDVPGTGVVRARAWSGLDPAQPCMSAPGTVTVVVVPGLPAARPVPTAALLRQVRHYLCERRTLGTRLIVAGPAYVEVSVRAIVHALPGADPARVSVAATNRLYAFLHPQRGGPFDTGWPFGRDVYEAELLRVLDVVDGVDHVEQLELTADGVTADCGNVCIGPTALVVSGTHEVIVR